MRGENLPLVDVVETQPPSNFTFAKLQSTENGEQQHIP